MVHSHPAQQQGDNTPARSYQLSPRNLKHLLDKLSDDPQVTALYSYLQRIGHSLTAFGDDSTPGSIPYSQGLAHHTARQQPLITLHTNNLVPPSSTQRLLSDAGSQTEFVKEGDSTQLASQTGPARLSRISTDARYRPYQQNTKCIQGGVKYHSTTGTRQKKAWARSSVPARITNSQVFSMLAALASPSPDLALRWANDVGGRVGSLLKATETGSMEAAVSRCIGATGRSIASKFMLMIVYIELILNCHKIFSQDKSATLMSLHEGLDMVDKPSKRTFMEWHARGSKYAAVAAGGTLYALVLVAGTGLRVRLGEIDGNAAWVLGNALQSELEGRLVSRHVIPLIACMRARLPFKLANLFSEVLLEEHGLAEANGANLEESDCLLSGIRFNTFALLERSEVIWASCCTASQQESQMPEPSALPPSMFRSPDGTSADLETIRTAYQPDAASNLKERIPEDRSATFAWTEQERKRTDNSLEAANIGDLREKLSGYYKEGICANFEQYLRISPSVVDTATGKALRIEGSDGSLMAFLSTAMPADSAQAGEDYQFQVLYFSWYNRHCTRGDDAPTDVSPLELVNSAASRMNHTQFTPYTSREMREQEELYTTTKMVFNDIFEWVASTLEAYLSDEFEILKIEGDALLGNNQSTVYPFTGFVINLNVTTKAHRDARDKLLCLLFPLGKFEDRALVLLEPGLVLPLRSGDLVAFPSCDITHFNRHFKGLRASMVLQTNIAMESWTKDGNRNGWKDNSSLR
ncbi:hypothetical protein BV25DRAFT_1832844 [Artomyces pyxidatus]|uniref:Uncharacterized protein n=1 Tax=Artomyces pyxidatus TaxID=48021 RepID=A0ACB8SH19_9AGAM|nr:hypothetical protein BV25DRAFT_1832844 [Artomyces pyxidatus]